MTGNQLATLTQAEIRRTVKRAARRAKQPPIPAQREGAGR